MFGFNKKKHRSNIRVKREDEDEEPDPEPVSKPKKVKASKKSKEDKGKVTKLSFDDEINNSEVDFKVKKSSISRKLAREREREKSKKIKSDQENEKDLEKFQIIDDLDGIEVDDNLDDILPPQFSNAPAVAPVTTIPDAYAIHQARKKREEARKTNEYIPVNRDKVYKASKSRLIREDDNDGDDDDEIIEMKVNTEEDDVDDITLDDGFKDEAVVKWEEEQIKKGSSVKTYFDVAPSEERLEALAASVPSTAINISEYIPDIATNDISLDILYRELESEITSLEELVRNNDKDLQSTLNAIEQCEANIAKYEIKSSELSSSFEFYQQTKCYINDFSTLISMRIESIQSIESELLGLFKQKCVANKDKRRNLQDQLAAQLGIISGDKKQSYIDIPAKVGDTDEEVDEDFVTEYNRIVDKSETIMGDVRPEYTDLAQIKERFERWKYTEPESYKNAYIIDCIPKVMAPLIRLEMVGWNPLQSKCPCFEDYSWFKILMSYGIVEEQESDSDVHLIPLVVNKVLVPKITRLVRECWDTMSAKQTKRLTKLIKLILTDYTTSDTLTPELKKLIEGIQYEIEQLIIYEAFLPLTIDRSSNINAKIERILSLQYAKCIKILKNILLWDGILERELVFKLSIDSLLNRHLITHLQSSTNITDTIDKIDMIIKCLPTSWFEGSSSLLPQLLPFANYLSSLSTIIDRRVVQCTTDVDKKQHKTYLRKVKSMLLRINAIDIVRNAK